MEKEIRTLPMSKEGFKGWDYAQMQIHFFMEQLKESKKYRYYNNKMNTNLGTLILFQYDGEIIASATYLNTIEKIDGEYKGYYEFDIDSIKIFKPIKKEELIEELKLDKDFKFGQASQKIKSDIYSTEELIEKVREIIRKKSY